MKYLLALALVFALTLVWHATHLQDNTKDLKRVDQPSNVTIPFKKAA